MLPAYNSVRMAQSEEYELQTLRTPCANNQIQEPQESRKLPKHEPERSCPFNIGIGLFVVQGGAIDEQDEVYLPQPVTSPTTIAIHRVGTRSMTLTRSQRQWWLSQWLQWLLWNLLFFKMGKKWTNIGEIVR